MKANVCIGALVLGLTACQNAELWSPEKEDEGMEMTMAKVFSQLPLDSSHLNEVFNAVSSSSTNGYDEEYRFLDLLGNPGAGVGDGDVFLPASKGPATVYERPLKDLLAEYFEEHPLTKAGGAEESLELLRESDCQIYWPYSEEWDGKTFPLITFNPGTGMDYSEGYEIRPGSGKPEPIRITEELAKERPVWVINTNNDADYTPAKIFLDNGLSGMEASARADGEKKLLLLRNFKMLRNYDNWLEGGSEFFIKCGAVNGFKASKEEDLAKFSPSVTDCMVVVKRKQLGLSLPLGVVLLTDFTDQMENIAFMITEDDGGTVTQWKCEAMVKYNSKSYGFTLDIPYRSKDDIVWRGQLSRDYLTGSRYTSARLGDVEVTFEYR
ncbi:MAG: hypothetical protein SPK08_04355 [Candidatus Cryptobacteroides sp.]|nr:hypothetical protein [Rikenellaceae bacterium]MDY5746748.1 hypothetical protein [Candidatus Cryptobacteroides sp.]